MHALKRHECELMKQKVSSFPLEGYSDNENLWLKIMSLEVGQAKQKTIQNMKVNKRIIRAKEMIYISQFEPEIILTDY